VPISYAVGEPIVVTSTEDARAATDSLRSALQGLVSDLQRDYPDAGAGQWWYPRSLGGTAPTPEEAAAADAARAERREAEKQR
jgi:hypothetical protein